MSLSTSCLIILIGFLVAGIVEAKISCDSVYTNELGQTEGIKSLNKPVYEKFDYERAKQLLQFMDECQASMDEAQYMKRDVAQVKKETVQKKVDAYEKKVAAEQKSEEAKAAAIAKKRRKNDAETISCDNCESAEATNPQVYEWYRQLDKVFKCKAPEHFVLSLYQERSNSYMSAGCSADKVKDISSRFAYYNGLVTTYEKLEDQWKMAKKETYAQPYDEYSQPGRETYLKQPILDGAIAIYDRTGKVVIENYYRHPTEEDKLTAAQYKEISSKFNKERQDTFLKVDCLERRAFDTCMQLGNAALAQKDYYNAKQAFEYACETRDLAACNKVKEVVLLQANESKIRQAQEEADRRQRAAQTQASIARQNSKACQAARAKVQFCVAKLVVKQQEVYIDFQKRSANETGLVNASNLQRAGEAKILYQDRARKDQANYERASGKGIKAEDCKILLNSVGQPVYEPNNKAAMDRDVQSSC